MRRSNVTVLVFLLATGVLAWLVSCTGESSSGPANGGGNQTPATSESGSGDGGGDGDGDGDGAAETAKLDALVKRYEQHFDMPTVEYRWDPKAGDPSVSAEDGGPGFTGEGWDTNMEFTSIASPDAVRGGSVNMVLYDWPATLRLHGKDYNSTFNYMVRSLCMETLIDLHPVTLEFMPSLATHWQITEDKQTYRFRINPAARFSDGSEITAEDVVQTYRFMVDETCLFPSSVYLFQKLDEPKAISKYIVEVKVNEESWRNFLYFGASMYVFPAKEIAIGGTRYLDEFNNKYTAMSGPYEVKVEDVVPGKSLTIRRRNDWWGEDNPASKGYWNIETFKCIVVKDPGLAFEKAKAGELDYWYVPRAQWWAEEVPEADAVKRGLLLPKKFYNDNPIGTNGIALNSTRPPLDDVRIRKALQLLMNRPLMIEKLYFNEYEPLESYWQGGLYQNPNNKVFPYDPVGAVELLEQAGWTELNNELVRVKEGKELELTVQYASKFSESALTIYQEDCAAAGIKLVLQQLTPPARWKNATEKQYELTSQPWGAIVFPNPETSWHSRLADKSGNNNITAFADPKIDELCKTYDRAYSVKDRIGIIQEMDGIIYEQHPYVLQWYNPSHRMLVSNKFSYPPWAGGRFQDWDELHFVWWVDPAKEKRLEAARKDQSVTLPREEIENRFWPAWNHARKTAKGDDDK